MIYYSVAFFPLYYKGKKQVKIEWTMDIVLNTLPRNCTFLLLTWGWTRM